LIILLLKSLNLQICREKRKTKSVLIKGEKRIEKSKISDQKSKIKNRREEELRTITT
jgi:hypothetical protein